MGFITLQDGELIHGSELPILDNSLTTVTSCTVIENQEFWYSYVLNGEGYIEAINYSLT